MLLSFDASAGRPRLCPQTPPSFILRSSRFTHDIALFAHLPGSGSNIFLQCDEGHPVCRNCVKSKRECLGYDPVFRPTASAPSAIQPAPNPPPSLVVNPQGPPVAAAPLYPSAPPGYMPASSQPFAPSLHSESPSTSTDHQTDHRASVDTSIAPPHTQQAPTTMQASHEPRPQSSEPVYKGTRTILVTFVFFNLRFWRE